MTQHSDNPSSSDIANAASLLRRYPANRRHELINAIDGFRNGLRHLDQRWKDGLALNNAGLVEKYLSGRFSVTLYLQAAGAEADHIDSPAGANGHRGINQSVVVLIDSIDPGDSLGDQKGDQEAVFVAAVESPDRPEKAFSGFVRSYLIEDEFADAGNGHLYGSIPALATGLSANDLRLGAKGRFEFLPAFPHREGEMRVLPSEQLIDGVIKRAPEIVDCVAERERNFGWQRINGNYAKSLASVRLILHHELAEVRFEEGFPVGLELTDVLVGPYML